MHAEHVHRERVRGVEAAEPHECRRDRDFELQDERLERAARVAVDDAAADVEQRALAVGEHRQELFAFGVAYRVAFDFGHAAPVARDRQVAVAAEDAFPVLHVLRYVDDHGPRPPGSGDLERGAHGCFEPFRVRDEKHVFRNGTHDRADRRFLEGIGADGTGRHLTADDDDRSRVRHAVAHGGHTVRGAGTRGHHDDADLTARPRVAGRHEARALLVRRNDQRHRLLAGRAVRLVIAEHGIVGRQNRAAAITENRVDAFVRQDLNDRLRTGHSPAGKRMCGVDLSLGLRFHGGRFHRARPVGRLQPGRVLTKSNSIAIALVLRQHCPAWPKPAIKP